MIGTLTGGPRRAETTIRAIFQQCAVVLLSVLVSSADAQVSATFTALPSVATVPSTAPTSAPVAPPTTASGERPALSPATRLASSRTSLPTTGPADIQVPDGRAVPFRSVQFQRPKEDAERFAAVFCVDGTMLAYGGHTSRINGSYQIVRWDLETLQAIDMSSGSAAAVQAIATNPLGNIAVIASAYSDKPGGITGYAVRLLDLDRGRETHDPVKLPGGKPFMCVSSDGKTAYIGQNYPERGVSIWDLATARRMSTIACSEGMGIQLIAADPGGRFLVVAAREKILVYLIGKRIWRPLNAHHKAVTHLILSPDGSRLATGSDDQEVCLWDMERLQLLATLRGHGSEITGVAFSPDGKFLATTAGLGYDYDLVKKAKVWNENSLCLWDVAAAKRIGSASLPQSAISGLAFSPDGQLIRCLSQADMCEYKVESLIRADTPLATTRPHGMDIAPLGSLALEDFDGSPICLQFSADSQLLTVVTRAHVLSWQVLAGRQQRKFLFTEPVSLFSGPVVTIDSRRLRTFSLQQDPDDLRLCVLCAQEWKEMEDNTTLGIPTTLWRVPEKELHMVLLSEDGQRLLTISGAHFNDGTTIWGNRAPEIRLRSTSTGRELTHFPDSSGVMNCATLSRDGKLAYIGRGQIRDHGYADCDIQVWDLEKGKLQHSLTGHKSPLTCLITAAKGKSLYAGSIRELTKWDTLGRRVLWQAEVASPVTAIAVSADGDTLACGHSDSSLSFWDARTGTPLGIAAGFRQPVTAICFAPNEKLVASFAGERCIRLWQIKRSATSAPAPASLATAPRR